MDITSLSTQELQAFVQRLMTLDGFAPTADFKAAMQELQARNA